MSRALNILSASSCADSFNKVKGQGYFQYSGTNHYHDNCRWNFENDNFVGQILLADKKIRAGL